MHNQGILHRDIKPENILIGSDGYSSLTDMGISRMWKEDNGNDTSGTPGYMAPEVMMKESHGIGVDYYGLGVIGFEIIFGRRPT